MTKKQLEAQVAGSQEVIMWLLEGIKWIAEEADDPQKTAAEMLEAVPHWRGGAGTCGGGPIVLGEEWKRPRIKQGEFPWMAGTP